MYRVAALKAPLVLHLPRLVREVRAVVAIELRERRADFVALIGIADVVEKAAADDLERLAGFDWVSGGLDAAEGVLDLLKRVVARRAADLDVGFRQRGDKQRVGRRLGRFGQVLDERQVRIERAAPHLRAPQVADVGDQLIYEDDAGADGRE